MLIQDMKNDIQFWIDFKDKLINKDTNISTNIEKINELIQSEDQILFYKTKNYVFNIFLSLQPEFIIENLSFLMECCNILDNHYFYFIKLNLLYKTADYEFNRRNKESKTIDLFIDCLLGYDLVDKPINEINRFFDLATLICLYNDDKEKLNKILNKVNSL